MREGVKYCSSFLKCAIFWRKSVLCSGYLYLSGASYSLVASVKAIDGDGRVAFPHKSRRDTQLSTTRANIGSFLFCFNWASEEIWSALVAQLVAKRSG